MTNTDIRYGSDDTGRVWRASPTRDDSTETILEVMYPDSKAEWDFWAIMDNMDMNDITFQKGIVWIERIEV